MGSLISFYPHYTVLFSYTMIAVASRFIDKTAEWICSFSLHVCGKHPQPRLDFAQKPTSQWTPKHFVRIFQHQDIQEIVHWPFLQSRARQSDYVRLRLPIPDTQNTQNTLACTMPICAVLQVLLHIQPPPSTCEISRPKYVIVEVLWCTK